MSLSQNPSRALTSLEYYQHLNTKQVMGVIGATNVRTVWKYVEEGKLPKPHYPSNRHPVWRLGEVVDVFGQHLAPYDAAPRSFGGSGKQEQAVAPEVAKGKEKGSSAADKIRERLGIKRR